MSDLFPQTHARVSDPITSRLAAPDPEKLTVQALQVLRSYRSGGALLDVEAYARAHMIGHQRCSDLRERGYIERCGRKVMPSGKTGYVCRITPSGRAWLERHPIRPKAS